MPPRRGCCRVPEPARLALLDYYAEKADLMSAIDAALSNVKRRGIRRDRAILFRHRAACEQLISDLVGDP
jgi:hypothetical protein